MKEDCRNDCTRPLLFPKEIYNRPGLRHIAYRIGTYSDFREALLRNLNKVSVLEDWTHREADDPGIALLEGASILGDILTFYQETYANEAYLRTAAWRESVADLVRLLGYRLSPGLGGKATLAFRVKGEKPVIIPAGFQVQAQVEGLTQPADFETTAEYAAEPALSSFHLYGPNEEPDVSPGVKELRIINSEGVNPGIEFEEGDRVLIGDPDSTTINNPEIIIVESTRELLGETLITFKGEIRSDNHGRQVNAYKLDRTFRHFGYNAPREIVRLTNGNGTLNVISFERSLSHDTVADGKKVVHPSPLSPRDVPLDSEVTDLLVGQYVIVELLVKTGSDLLAKAGPLSGSGAILFLQKNNSEKKFILRRIEAINPSAMTWGAISSGNTTITLDDTMVPKSVFSLERESDADIRTIQIHDVIGQPFQIGAARKPVELAKKNELFFYGDYRAYRALQDRRVQMVKGDISEEVRVVGITEETDPPDSYLLRKVTIDRKLVPEQSQFSCDDFPLDDPVVTVYGNLVDATQGKSEDESVLGNGDNREIFQTFKVPGAPLTYHNSPGESPPEAPELQIYVNDFLWTRVPSLFGRGPKEEIYIVREDAEGDSWVQFGDGKTGARLPSGVGNVVAAFRTGAGAYGALKEDTTVQPGGSLDRLDKIHMPGGASGGSEPENAENARQAAPGKIQSLDRLVSLSDFESETLAIAGVAKAKAAWDLIDNSIPAVILTTLMETGRGEEIDEVRSIINNYNNCRGPQRFPVRVCQGKRIYVYVDAVFGIHPAFREEIVKKAIQEALGVNGGEGNGIDGAKGLFGLYQRRFGEDEYATRIAGTVQNVEGVVWAKVKALGILGEEDEPSELSLPDEPKPFARKISCSDEQIFSLYIQHFQMSVAAAERGEVC